MTLKVSQGVRDSHATDAKGLYDGGTIEIYSGIQPNSPNDAVTGALLARVTLNGDAWVEGTPTNGLVYDSVAGGILEKPAAAIWRYTGIAAGVAGWFRLRGVNPDAGGASTALPRLDGSIGRSNADLILSTTTIQVGVPGSIDVFRLTYPENC